MYKKIIKYVISIAIIVIIISIISIVYSYSNKTNEGDVYEKIEQEIAYVDRKILELMKGLNNLNAEYLITNNVKNSTGESSNSSGNNESSSKNDQSSKADGGGGSSSGNQGNNITISTKETESVLLRDRNDIDWTYIQSELEKIINSWSVITIDLKSININNDNILAFNSNADTALKYIQAKDKANSLINLANLYSLIPEYKSEYSNDSKKIEIAYIKSDFLSSYALLESGQWDRIYALLSDADKRTSTLINSNNTDMSSNQNIQKSYILLKEFIKSANDKDVNLCYMKFYYLIEELENIDY